jgi:hypothetical protein
MLEIGGSSVKGGLDTLWMGGVGALIEGGTNTLASSGSNTFVGVGVGTSIGTRCRILANGSAGMLLWSSMVICAREGLGIWSDNGAFTATCDSVGGAG